MKNIPTPNREEVVTALPHPLNQCTIKKYLHQTGRRSLQHYPNPLNQCTIKKYLHQTGRRSLQHYPNPLNQCTVKNIPAPNREEVVTALPPSLKPVYRKKRTRTKQGGGSLQYYPHLLNRCTVKNIPATKQGGGRYSTTSIP